MSCLIGEYYKINYLLFKWKNMVWKYIEKECGVYFDLLTAFMLKWI